MKYLVIMMMAGTMIACNSNDKQAGHGTHTNDSLQARNDSARQMAMKDSSTYTTIEWIDAVNTELGKIPEGQVVEISWRFKNTGSTPLIIENVIAGCGCTVAQKPEQPIAPGGEDVIKAKFDSKGQGPTIHKSVTVVANTKGSTAHYLSFSGSVTK